MLANFFSRLFSFLFPVTPESIKKQKMRELAGKISRSRMAKFYKPKKKEITGEFGKFMYEIYKTVAAAQIYLKTAPSSAVLKQLAAESFFDRYVWEINEFLTGDVGEWAKLGEVDAVVDIVNEKQDAFSSFFDGETEKAVDYCYNAVLALASFSVYGYFALLKSFSAEMREQNFTNMPKFSSVHGAKVSEKLKDFLEVASALGKFSGWERVVNIIKEYRPDVTVIDYGQWSGAFEQVQLLLSSNILEMMIAHSTENPDWRFKPRMQTEQFAKKYHEARVAETKEKLAKLVGLEKDRKKDELLIDVFGRIDLQRAQHYTEAASEIYTNKKFTGFVHAQAVNYFFAFIIDVFAGGIKELCEMLMIRGKWLSHKSRTEMADHYHKIIDMADKFNDFDVKFSSLGKYGSRLRTSIGNADKNSSNARLVSSIISSGNNEALTLINSGLPLIVGLDLCFKSLINDRLKSVHTLIGNWDEMDALGVPLTDRLKTASVKLNAFAKLMFFLAGVEFNEGYNAFVKDHKGGLPHF